MKLVHVEDHRGEVVVGALLPDGSVVPISGLLGAAAPATVAEALAGMDEFGAQMNTHIDTVRSDPAVAVERGWLISADDAVLRAPVGQRQLMVCVGANYAAHTAEFGVKAPEKPVSFVKSCSAVIGPNDDILLPRSAPKQVDYEGELCVVFGKTCHAVAVDEAMSFVAGFTLLNDVSARDHMPAMLQASGRDAQWALIEMLMGKQFPTFAPVGPAVVTIDEIANPAAIRLTTTLNGKTMQDATTSDLIVDIPHLIAAMSRYYVFRPGDLLSTGSPAGVGASQDPPAFLKPGDVVAVSAEGVGVLSNHVRAA